MVTGACLAGHVLRLLVGKPGATAAACGGAPTRRRRRSRWDSGSQEPCILVGCGRDTPTEGFSCSAGHCRGGCHGRVCAARSRPPDVFGGRQRLPRRDCRRALPVHRAVGGAVPRWGRRPQRSSAGLACCCCCCCCIDAAVAEAGLGLSTALPPATWAGPLVFAADLGSAAGSHLASLMGDGAGAGAGADDAAAALRRQPPPSQQALAPPMRARVPPPPGAPPRKRLKRQGLDNLLGDVIQQAQAELGRASAAPPPAAAAATVFAAPPEPSAAKASAPRRLVAGRGAGGGLQAAKPRVRKPQAPVARPPVATHVAEEAPKDGAQEEDEEESEEEEEDPGMAMLRFFAGAL
mmetsp:Transcript_91482/g.296040  ORF Transcript_91482/g.296040 Transcript_91482/m.296040 type:complete len:350 (+) Transcript_91482:715-1764(+)